MAGPTKKVASPAATTVSTVAAASTETLAAQAHDAAATAAAAVSEVVITGAGASGADTLAIRELLENVLPEVLIEAPVADFTFPAQVTLSNNGGFAVSEPASGAFLQAGGMQTIWLHDEAHASRVRDNLRELAKRHNLAGLLLVNGVPLDTDD